MRAANWTFPLRNRIIAGVSSAVLVIEAREKSGTLITARHALEFGREVLAVPGSIFSATSKTPHDLIRDGATPITSADDIFEALGIATENEQGSKQKQSLSPDEHQILDLLTEPRSTNDLARLLVKPVGEVQRTLALLEIHGMVSVVVNNTYRRTHI